jgi:hypothetical protein
MPVSTSSTASSPGDYGTPDSQANRKLIPRGTGTVSASGPGDLGSISSPSDVPQYLHAARWYVSKPTKVKINEELNRAFAASGGELTYEMLWGNGTDPGLLWTLYGFLLEDEKHYFEFKGLGFPPGDPPERTSRLALATRPQWLYNLVRDENAEDPLDRIDPYNLDPTNPGTSGPRQGRYSDNFGRDTTKQNDRLYYPQMTINAMLFTYAKKNHGNSLPQEQDANNVNIVYHELVAGLLPLPQRQRHRGLEHHHAHRPANPGERHRLRPGRRPAAAAGSSLLPPDPAPDLRPGPDLGSAPSDPADGQGAQLEQHGRHPEGLRGLPVVPRARVLWERTPPPRTLGVMKKHEARAGIVALGLGLALLGTPATAQYSKIKDLAGDVTNRIGTCNGRLQGTADEVTIRAKRLTRLLSSGEAFYNKIYNQVLVDPDLVDTDGTIKDLDELKDGAQYYGAFVPTATIYHEVGHAEWDVFIEEQETPQDKRFYRIVKYLVKPWIDRVETHIDKPELAVQEWHGYFRGQTMMKMLSDWNDLLFWNGLNPATGKVDEGMVRSSVRTGRIKPEFFDGLAPEAIPSVHDGDADKPYLDRIRGYDFAVSNGRIDGLVDVDTSTWTEERGFSDTWWQRMWDHSDHFHCLPDSLRELARRVAQRNADEVAKLKPLRERFLAEFQAEQAAAAAEAAGEDGGGDGRLYGVPDDR